MGVTHPVLCGNAVQNIAASQIEELIVTETVHMDDAKHLDKISKISVAPLMAQAISRIHTGDSVGALFNS